LNSLNISKISKIVLVVNEYDKKLDEAIPEKIKDLNIKIPIEFIFRENKNLSYGAWNAGIINNIDSEDDYFFLIEDDYIPVVDHFYDPFIEQNGPFVGYIAQLMNFMFDPPHASISNGIIPVWVAKRIKSGYDSVFLLEEPKPEYQNMDQVTFLDHIRENKLIFKDVSETTHIPFLDSSEYEGIEDKIVYYGNDKSQIILEPAQNLLKRYNIYKPNPRFKLRPMKESDIKFVNSIRNGYSKEYLHDSRTFTDDECLEWFRKTNPSFHIISFDNEDIGYFRTSNYSKENNHICVGCDIDPKYVGKGYGFASYLVLFDYLFNEKNINKIYLEVLSTNKRAIHLYEKLGFVTEGIKREEVLKGDIYIDSKIMSILKKEYN
jgi:RimJ/RimL family protein N-acetyltransferase